MRKRFYSALAAYAALGASAYYTLDGKLRAIVLIFLGGLAIKTLVAYKSGMADR